MKFDRDLSRSSTMFFLYPVDWLVNLMKYIHSTLEITIINITGPAVSTQPNLHKDTTVLFVNTHHLVIYSTYF